MHIFLLSCFPFLACIFLRVIYYRKLTDVEKHIKINRAEVSANFLEWTPDVVILAFRFSLDLFWWLMLWGSVLWSFHSKTDNKQSWLTFPKLRDNTNLTHFYFNLFNLVSFGPTSSCCGVVSGSRWNHNWEWSRCYW